MKRDSNFDIGTSIVFPLGYIKKYVNFIRKKIRYFYVSKTYDLDKAVDSLLFYSKSITDLNTFMMYVDGKYDYKPDKNNIIRLIIELQKDRLLIRDSDMLIYQLTFIIDVIYTNKLYNLNYKNRQQISEIIQKACTALKGKEADIIPFSIK